MEDNLTCKELVELVTEYLEGTLPEAIHLRMDHHLSDCDGCTHYVEQMRQTIRLTGRLKEESLMPHQRDDLLRLFRDWKKS
ncbi:MAG: anti-sigma factor [Anaerolineales bacterium]|nr:zf-HC2 domain-containing protein [Anaerolineae bacterium]PWB74404.1 MAG: anti-sigma factor [Anaerolineales bacterium]